MNIISIEHGIPIPSKDIGAPGEKRIRYNRYPWRLMDVGDSFFLPSNGVSPSELQDKLICAAKEHARKRPGWAYTSRRVDGGARIWRIA